jgi:hypothetical protein
VLGVQLLPRCSRGDVADSFAPGLGAAVWAVLQLVVVFSRALAAACGDLVRGGQVGVTAALSVVSQVRVLALVSVWRRCSAIGCLAVLGLVVVDGCADGTCSLPGARSRLVG